MARDLDLTESALRNWVERARADRTQGRRGLTTEEREELRRLRKENRRLRVERDVLKKAAAFFARGERVRFAFIQAEKASMSLTHLCQILDVSRSGFYAWQRRPASTHARRDQQLRVLIRASHEVSRGTYGSPRLHRDLQAQGHRVSRKRVIRLKQAEGLTARVRKRFKRTTISDHDQPVATNVLG